MNKMLMIDDDKMLCTFIKRHVLSKNIEADFCNTGQEYQLIILNVRMPSMDDFKILEEFRKESSPPILMFALKNDSVSKVYEPRKTLEETPESPRYIQTIRDISHRFNREV